MISSRHGVTTEIKLNGITSDKKSMSMVCEDLNLMNRWHNNELEGGKGYPDKEAKGTFPGLPDDVVSVVPPADGHILSGGRTDARDCVNFTNQEMRIKTENTNFNWADTAIKVKSGDVFETKWTYSAQHKTRGYDWWITEKPIDFSHRLTRDDLKEPFYKDYSIDTPFWSYPLPVKETTSTVLPDKAPGLYVMMERWIIADTGNAFHQSWVLEYEDTSSNTMLTGHCPHID